MLFITKQKPNTYLNKKLEQTQIPMFETKTINYISRTYNFSSRHIDKNKNVASIPSNPQSNQSSDSSTSVNNNGVKWDSSPLIPDTDDIPF